jgi:two-component system, cell cycle response regulator
MTEPKTADASAYGLCDRSRARLLVLKGPGVGDVHPVQTTMTIIGRAPGADIRLPDPSISRFHARLSWDDDRLSIEDLDSKNGTYVGIRRLTSPRVLVDGEAIGVGPSTLLEVTYGRSIPAAWSAAEHPGDYRRGAAPTREAYLLDRLAAEHALAQLRRQPLSLVFFRVDGLAGRCRPTVSPAFADEMMGRAAAAIYESILPDDVLARSAVDTWLCLIRGEATTAVETAERVRLRLRDGHATGCSEDGWPTVTAVVMPLAVGGGVNVDGLLAKATTAASRCMDRHTDRVVSAPAIGRIVG